MLWAGLASAAVIGAPFLLAPDRIARLLRPLHAISPGVGRRAHRPAHGRARASSAPRRTCSAPASAAPCWCRRCSSASTSRSRTRIGLPLPVIAPGHLIVPCSFIVQMLPVSVNGFGVREAIFGFYFTRLGLPLDSAILAVVPRRGAHHALLGQRRRRLPDAPPAVRPPLNLRGGDEGPRRLDARLEHLADDVGRLVLRLVVGARLQLGEQAERHELHAGEDQQDAEQQQRPVADGLV